MNFDFSLREADAGLSWCRCWSLSMMAHEVAHAFVALPDSVIRPRKAPGRLSFNPLKHMDPMGTAMFFITYLLAGSSSAGQNRCPSPPTTSRTDRGAWRW